MKMDTLGTGRRRAGNRSGSRANVARSKARHQSRAQSPARKTTKARAGGAAPKRSTKRGGSAQVTTDLNEIRQWAEARGGKPVSVKGTSRRGSAGLLRIDFPGYSGAGRFEEVSWDEWYDKFKESNLEFLYQDQAANGQQSRFFKLVCRGTAKGNAPRGGSRMKSRSAGGGRAQRSRSRSGAGKR